MDSWVIDANEMAAPQVSVFKTNLLHPTRAIKRFLEPTNNTTTIIVAPKGFGKTLLLKAKRLSIANESIKILPSGQALLDKPSGYPSPASAKEYGDTRDNPGYWKSLWTISISIAVLKNEGLVFDELESATKRIMTNALLKSPCDIFDAILSASYTEYQQIINDYNDQIVLRIRDIHHQVLIFIDNIDEYYEDMLRAQKVQVGTNMYGAAKEAFWYLAQLGVALAARELNEINSHLRVYAAMRGEVLQRGVTNSAFGLQLKGRSILIEYSDADLKLIIEKNITQEPGVNLVLKASPSPIEGFLGKERETIHHPKTGDEEDFADFWTRHTLRRPRDIIMIGKRISEIAPSERTLPNLRAAVRAGSREIAHGYLAEMEPHLPGFDPDLIIRMLPKNTLSLREISNISKEYAATYKSKHEIYDESVDHVFCALFKIGLLGYVGPDVETGERIQVFCRPGSEAIEGVGVLPEADTYLVHPVLDDLIISRTPKYYSRLNELNVIGMGRPWREERSISYVLKGDLAGYSETMKDVPKSRRFGDLFRSAAKDYLEKIDFWKIEGGDSIILIDTNPVSVITAAQQLEERISNSEFGLSFRFGGEAGYVLIEGAEGERVPSGMSIRTAARIEPHVAPGSIWVTEEFRRRVTEQFKNDVYAFTSVDADEAATLDLRDGKFNLAKNVRDEPILTALFAVRAM